MGPDGAVNILFRKELKKAEDVEKKRKELQDDYREKFANHTGQPNWGMWTKSSNRREPVPA